jgi:hypothetical protein
LGDVNPRQEDGVFVKRDGNSIEVVSTYNLEQCGEKGYRINSRTDEINDILERYKEFKDNPEQKSSVGSFADWKRYLQLEAQGLDFDSIAMYLATDMILYYGGDCESESGTNYWEMLSCYGITPKNYI